MNIPEWEEIERRAATDPRLYYLVRSVNIGECTKEEGLRFMVCFLADQNEELYLEKLKMLMHGTQNERS
jgi:hypothetical protein